MDYSTKGFTHCLIIKNNKTFHNNLYIYYQNVNSIKNKYDEFLKNISLSVRKYDIIILTETWCKEISSTHQCIEP